MFQHTVSFFENLQQQSSAKPSKGKYVKNDPKHRERQDMASQSKVKKIITDMTEIRRPQSKIKNGETGGSSPEISNIKYNTFPKTSRHCDDKTRSSGAKKHSSLNEKSSYARSLGIEKDASLKRNSRINRKQRNRLGEGTVRESAKVDSGFIDDLNLEMNEGNNSEELLTLETLKIDTTCDNHNEDETSVLREECSISQSEGKVAEETKDKYCITAEENTAIFCDEEPTIEENKTEEENDNCRQDGDENDIFGLNDFSEDCDDNYIIEAYNDDDRELIFTFFEVKRKVRVEGSTEKFQDLMSSSDMVFEESEFGRSMELIKDLDNNYETFVEEEKEETKNSIQDIRVSEASSEDCNGGTDEDIVFTSEKRTISTSTVSLNGSAVSTDEEGSVEYRHVDRAQETYQSVIDFHGNVRIQRMCSVTDPEPKEGVHKNKQVKEASYLDRELRQEGESWLRCAALLNHSWEVPLHNKRSEELLLDTCFASKAWHSQEPTLFQICTLNNLTLFSVAGTWLKQPWNSHVPATLNNHYKPFITAHAPTHLAKKSLLMFGNIDTIFEEAQQFYEVLKERKDDVERIADAFIVFAPMFELYPIYSKNKPRADTYMKEFDEFIKAVQKDLGDRLDLASYLLTPVQRMGKYILMLENIQKELKKIEKPSSNIALALKILKKEMRKGNDFIAIDSIKQCPIDLRLEGGFRMRERFNLLRPRKFNGMVFLFENIVVFSSNSSKSLEEFVYVDSIKMNDLSIATFEQQPLVFHLSDYRKIKKGLPPELHTYILEAKTPKIKYLWTSSIENQLWKQLEEAKVQQTQLLRSPDSKSLFASFRKSETRGSKRKLKKSKSLNRSTSVFYDVAVSSDNQKAAKQSI